jgi:DDE superfamily endonuclease
MNLHLQEISTQVTQGAHAVITLDGAGWHQQGNKLKVPNNISLLPLPPYSPELNPQENIGSSSVSVWEPLEFWSLVVRLTGSNRV